MRNSENFIGVRVRISKDCKYPTPYGLHYIAKGAYRQGKFIVVVGHVKDILSE
jgi:hypothetical protein